MTTPQNAGYHEQQQDSSRNAAQREAEVIAREEQEFWDRAFCAALTGAALAGVVPVAERMSAIELRADWAARHADAALSARRQRQGRET